MEETKSDREIATAYLLNFFIIVWDGEQLDGLYDFQKNPNMCPYILYQGTG